MSIVHDELKKVAGRIRLVRAWRWFAIGILAGVALGLILWLLEEQNLLLLETWQLVTVVAASGIIGLIAGYFWKLEISTVARSIDSRANLKDRTASAVALDHSENAFAKEVQRDAQETLSGVDAKKVYPIRVGRWQYGALSSLVLAGFAYWLITSGTLLSPDRKKEIEELKQVAEKVERIAKDFKESPVKLDPKDEKAISSALEKLARELRNGNLNREEAMQKANELAKEAQKLSAEKFNQMKAEMKSVRTKMAENALAKKNLSTKDLQNLKMSQKELAMLQQMMQKSGAPEMKSEKLNEQAMKDLGMDASQQALAQLSKEQREALMEQIQQEINAAKSKQQSGQLSEKEQKQLAEQIKQMQELAKKLQASKEFQEALKELQNMKEYKELQKLLQEMQQKSESAEAGKPMTEEEIKQIQEQMEALIEAMKDPAMKEAIRQQLKEMLQAMKEGNLSAGAAAAGLGLFSSGMGGLSAGSSSHGGQSLGEGENLHRDDEMDLKGKTQMTGVKGERDESKGTSEYIEIKAPTLLGSKTSVPYKKVLPKYKKEAESALGEKKIPKDREERVREYFESLGGKS